MNKKLWTIIGLGLVLSFPSFGGDLNIYADKQVEIHQNEQKLVALGNADRSITGHGLCNESVGFSLRIYDFACGGIVASAFSGHLNGAGYYSGGLYLRFR